MSSLKLLYRNYDHVSSLWELENWINEKTAKEAKAHYAAYSVQRKDGLRIITLNTDLCKSKAVDLLTKPGLTTTYWSHPQGTGMY